jgi:hypothetical protein
MKVNHSWKNYLESYLKLFLKNRGLFLNGSVLTVMTCYN